MIAVMLLTEQCLHFKLHLSVTIIVPRIGSFFLNRIVLIPKFAKFIKEESFISFLAFLVSVSFRHTVWTTVSGYSKHGRKKNRFCIGVAAKNMLRINFIDMAVRCFTVQIMDFSGVFV